MDRSVCHVVAAATLPLVSVRNFFVGPLYQDQTQWKLDREIQPKALHCISQRWIIAIFWVKDGVGIPVIPYSFDLPTSICSLPGFFDSRWHTSWTSPSWQLGRTWLFIVGDPSLNLGLPSSSSASCPNFLWSSPLFWVELVLQAGQVWQVGLASIQTRPKTFRISPHNYDHQNQVKAWVIWQSRKKNHRNNFSFLLDGWTIKRRYHTINIWSMRHIKRFFVGFGMKAALEMIKTCHNKGNFVNFEKDWMESNYWKKYW